jgi:CRP/FNR family cyclic AMP-dependent transcriptional regulator
MVDHDVAEVLQQSFLGSLPDHVHRDVADSARIVDLPAGKLVYEPQLSIVLAGALRAFIDDGSGRHLTVSYVRRPHAIGIAGAAGQEFPVAFQAVTVTTILRISPARFDKIRRNHSELGWAAAKELALYLDGVLAEIARVAFQPLRARIAHHLLALADCRDWEHHAVHQAELAAAVGSVREVVNRTVGTLREAGLVDVSQAGVTVVNREGLLHVAGQRE